MTSSLYIVLQKSMNKLKSSNLKSVLDGSFYKTRSKNIFGVQYLLVINKLKSSLPLVLHTLVFELQK